MVVPLRSPTPVRGRSLVAQSGATTLIALVGLLTGLLVDVVVAGRFGAGAATDAFFVGARLPLAVAVVVLVGANQALVPAVAAWSSTDGVPAAGRRTSTVCLVAGGAGAALGLLLAGGSPWICRLQAPGLSSSGVHLAAQVLVVMSLTLPTTAVAEVLRAYLNAQRAFVVPALVTVVQNVAVIAVVAATPHPSVLTVAWGYAAGSALRLLLLLVMALRRGLHANPLAEVGAPEPWQASRLCLRPLAGAGLQPLVRVAEQALASALPTGSISLLNYGYRLVSGVGGAVLFRSVIVTLVPRLTAAMTTGRLALARELTALGTRLMVLVSVPLTTFLVVLAEPAVRLLFERGRFTDRSAATLGVLLTVLALSMPADAVNRAQMAPYFSKLDMRLPWRNNVLGMVVNLALLPLALLAGSPTAALLLVALAYLVSRWVTVVHGQWHLHRDGLDRGAQVLRTLRLLALPTLLASGAMAGLAGGLQLYGADASPRLAVGLAVSAAAGAVVLVGGLVPARAALRALVRTPAGDPAAPRQLMTVRDGSAQDG